MVITLRPEFQNIPTKHFTEIESYTPSMHLGSAPILIEGRPHRLVHPHLKSKSYTPVRVQFFMLIAMVKSDFRHIQKWRL